VPETERLTGKEVDAYVIVLKFWLDRDRAPSAAQIGKRMEPKVSPTRANTLLHGLEYKGFIFIADPEEPEDEKKPRWTPWVGTDADQIRAELRRFSLEAAKCAGTKRGVAFSNDRRVTA